jgi:hypothetical protein
MQAGLFLLRLCRIHGGREICHNTRARKETRMAKLALVYGMRLFPAEDLAEVQEATLKLKNGRTARVTMHLIEGSKDEIEATLRQSVEAFFEMYPEI